MTNGIVSIVDATGQTLVKVVCGCDGYNAQKLAARLREMPTLDPDRIYNRAMSTGFGCRGCLVVQTREADLFKGDDELHALYREKFGDPRFNPRRDSGICSHTIVIETPVEAKAEAPQ